MRRRNWIVFRNILLKRPGSNPEDNMKTVAMDFHNYIPKNESEAVGSYDLLSVGSIQDRYRLLLDRNNGSNFQGKSNFYSQSVFEIKIHLRLSWFDPLQLNPLNKRSNSVPRCDNQ